MRSLRRTFRRRLFIYEVLHKLRSFLILIEKLIIMLIIRFFFNSVRDGDTVKHYRIRQLDEGGFFIARRTTFR